MARLLTAADILVTEVATHQQVLHSEQARDNGYLLELDHPVVGKITVTGCPVTLGGKVETDTGEVFGARATFGGSAAGAGL